MQFKINHPDKILRETITLPTSKSISNRLLILQALSKHSFEIRNLSSSEDTALLLQALNNKGNEQYVGAAGTTMRFLTAYEVVNNRDVIIKGTDRMHNRPIQKLVNALNQLGAKIEYLEKEGYPPLHIKPAKIEQSAISIDGSVSSQYITALLLIAPSLPEGLILSIKNELVSTPYVKLTLDLMAHFGIEYTWVDNRIEISAQDIVGKDITVEADWSGASYWYEMAALSNSSDLKIVGLQKNSLQGDAVIAEIFKNFGIETVYGDNFIQLKKSTKPIHYFEYDFSDCPDLVQTVVATCIGLSVPFNISGCKTLYIKETDRVKALITEFGKTGAIIDEPEHGKMKWDGSFDNVQDDFSFDTYEDHRMAMAFAPLALKFDQVVIHNPNVVTKSYPEFWDHMKSVGFEIN